LRRLVCLLALTLTLASCGREVPLRIGPLRLVMGLALLEVRVWNASACPAGADVDAQARAAADPRTLDQVAVARYFTGTHDATAVGAVPSGAHAVSVVVRDADCQVVLYGCTPAVDFATASAVNVTWAAVGPGTFCETFACESGACFEPRTTTDAGMSVDAD
jgi:hypothetical protein